MTPEAAQTMRDFNDAQTDWFGVCRVCKQRVHGDILSLRNHAKTHGSNLQIPGPAKAANTGPNGA